MARHERKCGNAPFVIEHGEVGMTYSAVANLNLYFVGSQLPRIEAERFKRGMWFGSRVGMKRGGHLAGSPRVAESGPHCNEPLSLIRCAGMGRDATMSKVFRHYRLAAALPASLPPSTTSECPVMNEAWSEARNSTAAATSLGSAIRPIGTPLAKVAFASGVPVNRSSIPVSTGPGATIFTLTPVPAASSAADFVKPSTACLLAA